MREPSHVPSATESTRILGAHKETRLVWSLARIAPFRAHGVCILTPSPNEPCDINAPGRTATPTSHRPRSIKDCRQLGGILESHPGNAHPPAQQTKADRGYLRGYEGSPADARPSSPDQSLPCMKGGWATLGRRDLRSWIMSWIPAPIGCRRPRLKGDGKKGIVRFRAECGDDVLA